MGSGQHRDQFVPPAGRGRVPVDQQECRGVPGAVLTHVDFSVVQGQSDLSSGMGTAVGASHSERIAISASVSGTRATYPGRDPVRTVLGVVMFFTLTSPCPVGCQLALVGSKP